MVLDLSCNRGGDAPAAIYTLAWMLGDATVNLDNPISGAKASSIYQADINMDRQFDDSDTVEDKNLYCLTSACSFSCGNLVPAMLKASGKLTLLGQKTQGGACTTQPSSMADGTDVRVSGWKRLCTVKNGAYEDIDDGVEPDYRINNLANFYDRASLTALIDSIK